MQRQSLGSPGRGVLVVAKDDAVLTKSDTNDTSKRRESFPSALNLAGNIITTDDDEIKPEKPLRCHSQPEKFIHFIPILIVFCFLVLYLSSHRPSPSDLAEFKGFKHPGQLIDETSIDEIGRVEEKYKGGIAIRSLRNLQEEVQRDDNYENEDENDNDITLKSRSHRKLGDFK